MQKSNKLSKEQMKILEKAKAHARKTYKKGLTSITAILTTNSGNTYTGINVKYKKIWKCICAERVAIAKAVEANDTDFDTITSVKYFPETDAFQVVNMCGECRQIAICHAPLKVIADNKGNLEVVPIEEIFPFPYS